MVSQPQPSWGLTQEAWLWLHHQPARGPADTVVPRAQVSIFTARGCHCLDGLTPLSAVTSPPVLPLDMRDSSSSRPTSGGQLAVVRPHPHWIQQHRLRREEQIFLLVKLSAAQGRWQLSAWSPGSRRQMGQGMSGINVPITGINFISAFIR